MKDSRLIITIDGPVASGKSTLAKRLANELGIYFLGTGLMFRGLAYLLVERAGYAEKDLYFPRMQDLATFGDSGRFVYEASGKIVFDGEDITPALKACCMDSAASIISTNPDVRILLLNIQRACAELFDLVAEGRDTGSVVFPQATVKFFLTASVHKRALWWQADQERRGNVVSVQEAVEIISARDKRDSERAVAPLVKPVGAVEIDTTGLELDQAIALMKSYIKK